MVKRFKIGGLEIMFSLKGNQNKDCPKNNNDKSQTKKRINYENLVAVLNTPALIEAFEGISGLTVPEHYKDRVYKQYYGI